MNTSQEKKDLLDYFPPPAFLLLSNAGISVTDKDIKFVRKKSAIGGGLQVVHMGINEGSDKVTILKEFSSRYGVKFIKAVLPEEKAYLFTATIDKVPPEGMYDAVAFIVEENVPVTLDEAVFDFNVVEEDEANDKIKIAVTVFSKEVVRTHIKLFESAGITPVSFSVEYQSISRAIVPRGDESTQLIVNLAPEKTGFYVVEKEIVQFSTTHAYGENDEDIEKNIKSLQTEIKKVIDFWSTSSDKSNSKSDIVKVLFTGSGAAREDLVIQLMQGIDVPHSIANVWVNASFGEKYISELPFDEYLDYASVIGLVLFHK